VCQELSDLVKVFQDKSKNVRWPRFFGPQCILFCQITKSFLIYKLYYSIQYISIVFQWK